jgi:phage major head subunit gpT-like protein
MPIAKHKIDHLNTDITTAFLDAYEGSMNDGFLDEITETIPMKGRTLEIPVRGFIGQMREWIGPRIIETVSYDRFEFKISKFEKTISVLVDDIADDNVGIYKGRVTDLGIAAAEWKGVQLAKTLEANGIGYDGVAYFSASHPTDQGNQSNFQSGANPAWYLFDTSRGSKPMIFGMREAPYLQPASDWTKQHEFFHDELVWGIKARGGAAPGLWQLAYKSMAALNEANLETALITMSERKNDRGDKIGIKGTLLVVPGSLQGDARRLLDRAVSSGTDNVYKGAVRWVIGDRLTGV